MLWASWHLVALQEVFWIKTDAGICLMWELAVARLAVDTALTFGGL